MTPKSPSKGYVEAWDVESLTDASKVYTVSKRRNGTYACSCPAWKFALSPKTDCKHIRALHNVSVPVPVSMVNVSVPVIRRMVTVMFDGVVVARITEAQAAVLRGNLSGMKAPEPVQPAVMSSGEFRITRKFKEF